jgi:hypothetical protein
MVKIQPSFSKVTITIKPLSESQKKKIEEAWIRPESTLLTRAYAPMLTTQAPNPMFPHAPDCRAMGMLQK